MMGDASAHSCGVRNSAQLPNMLGGSLLFVVAATRLVVHALRVEHYPHDIVLLVVANNLQALLDMVWDVLTADLQTKASSIMLRLNCSWGFLVSQLLASTLQSMVSEVEHG